MPAPKKNKIAKPVDEAPEVETESKTETVSEKEENLEPLDILLVIDPNASRTGAIYIRQYSQEVHGDDYKALAAEFCSQTPRGRKGVYIAVPASEIGDVEVRYREKRDAELHPDKQDPNAPVVDKVRPFGASNKNEAVRFGTQKYDSTVVVSKVKVNKDK